MPFEPVSGSDVDEGSGGGFVPVAQKFFGEEHPIVGEIPSTRGIAPKSVVSFPLPTDKDANNRIFLAESDDGGLPNVYKRTPKGEFVFSGRFDDGRRAGGQSELPPLDRPPAPAKLGPKQGVDPYSLLTPNMLSWLRSRNPERMKEVDDMLGEANSFGQNPGVTADLKLKAAKIVDEIMPKQGMTMYQSEKTQVGSGRLRNDRPTIIDADGRVQFFPPLKPRENVGSEVPLDESTLSGMHAEARKQYQKAIAPKSAAGRVGSELWSGIKGVSAAAWRPILPQDVSDEIVRNSQSQTAAFNELGGPIERQISGAAKSLGTMAAAAPLAAVSGGAAAPVVFGAASGLSTANQALTTATDAGMTGGARLGYAATQGLIEAGTSTVFSKLLKMPGLEGAMSTALGKPITTQTAAQIAKIVAARAGKAGLEEIPEELLTQVGSNIVDRLSGVDPERAILSPEEVGDIVSQSFLAAGAGNVPGALAGAKRPKNAQELMRNYPVGSTAKLATADASLPQDAKVAGYDGMNVVVKIGGRKQTVSPDQLVPEFTPYEHTSGFAGEWAMQNPQAAKELAAASDGKPSISDFKAAGLNPRGTSAAQREQFAAWVGEAVPPEKSAATSAGSDTGFMTPPVEQPPQKLGPKGPERITDRMATTLLNRGFPQEYIDSLRKLPAQQGATIAQGIIENRKGVKLGQKPAEVSQTDEEAAKPKTEAREALAKYVSENFYSDPTRRDIRDSDSTYLKLKEAADAEDRSNIARAAGQTRREVAAEREQATAAIEEGDVNRDNVKYAPLNQMEPALAAKVLDEAKRLLGEADSEETKAALKRIIAGDDVNAGAAVEAQKERIIRILSGELDQRTGWTRKTEAPRPMDATTLLLKSKEDRDAEIKTARKALADGEPNDIVDEARTMASEELNRDNDIDMPYVEPNEQQILDKIDEIAARVGVESDADSILEKSDQGDDSFDFGANVEEKSDTKSNDEQAEPPVKPGHIRFYHGGSEYEGGKRWITPDRAYAEGYAKKAGIGAFVHYVDVPNDHPGLMKSYDDEGVFPKAPYISFEADEELSSQLKPLTKPSSEEGDSGIESPESSSTGASTKQAAETPKESGPARLGSKPVGERYREVSGRELGEVFTTPTNDSQREAAEFFKARGKTLRFFRSPDGKAANSFHDPVDDVVYLNAEAGDNLNYLIGHEYAHASGADKRLANLPKPILDAAKAYYLERSAPNYREKLLQNDALLTREAVAVYVGKIFADDKLRAQIRNDHPGLLERIVEYVKSLFVDSGLPEPVRRVLDELNALPEKPAETKQETKQEQPRRKFGEKNRYDTYSGFAQPLEGSAAGEITKAVAERMGDNPKPKMTIKGLREEATARFKADPAKALADVKAALSSDELLTDKMKALVNVVSNHLGDEAARTGSAEAFQTLAWIEEHDLPAGSEVAKALRARGSDFFHEMDTETGRKNALASAMMQKTPEERKLLERIIERLKKEGKNPDDIALSEGFHGTPHVVDRFSTSKIGTGEGAQAYGWGLYFSSADEVARAYRDKLSRSYSLGEERLARYFKPGTQVPAYGGTMQTVLEFRPSTDKSGWSVKVRHADGYVTVHATEPDAATYTKVTGESLGQLYKVDLKPEEGDYLDWQKPMAKQSEKVKAAFGLDKILPKVAPLANRLKKVEDQIDKMLDSQDGYDNDVLYPLEEERDELVERIREITPIEKGLHGWYYPEIQMSGEAKYDELSKTFSGKYVSWIDEEGAVWAAADVFPDADQAEDDTSEMIANAIREMKDSVNGVPIFYESQDGTDYARIGDHQIQIAYGAPTGGARKASEYLLSKGIRGNTYIGDYKKSDGKGARNYVVFDENDIGDPELMLSESDDFIRRAIDDLSDSDRQKLGAAKKAAKKSPSLFDGMSAEEAYRAVMRAIAERQAEFRKLMVKKGIIPKTDAGYKAMIEDPLKTQAAIIQINAYKSSFADRLLEYWYNAVLSSPTTHAKNVTGNTLNAARMASNGFAKLVGEVATLQKKPEHAVAEVAAFWSGFWGGFVPALKNFRAAWATELSALSRQVGRDKRSSPLEWAEGVASIPGWWGKNLVRVPKRLMLAVDEFFKTLVVHTNVNVEAHRIAVEEGRTGKDLAARQAELVSDPTSQAWSNAYDTALEVSLQEEGGAFRQKLKGTIAEVRRIPYIGYLSKFLVPFTNIAINSAAQVGMQSPLGAIPMFAKIYENWTQRKDGVGLLDGLSGDLARQAVGLATTALVYSMVGDEDDEDYIKIVGKDVKDSRIPKYSIGIGNSWFQYSGVEPLGSFIGMIADGTKTLRKGGGDPMKIAGELASSVGNQLAEKPLLGAVSDMAKLLTADAGESTTSEKIAGGMVEWAGRFGGSFVPAVAKVPLRAGREESPERRGWKGNDAGETLGRIGDRALARTDLGLIEEAAKFDRWGRKYPETAIDGHPIADFLFRVLSPGKLVHFQPHDGDKLLANWNNAHPDEEYKPAELTPSYTVDGKTTYFSDEEFGRYAQRTGKLAAELFKLGSYDVEHPTAEQVDGLRDNFASARAAMKDVMQAEKESGKIEEPDYAEMARDIAVKQRKNAMRKLGEGMGRAPERESEVGWNRRFEKLQGEKEQARQRLGRIRL